MNEQYELTIDEVNEKIRRCENQIKALRTEIEQDTVMMGACRDTLNDLRKCLEKLEKEADIQIAQPEQRWIPVTERLPNTCVPVIVSVHDDSGDSPWDYTSEGWMTPGKNWVVDNDINWDVVAWMPLPKPYCPNFGAKMGGE